LNHVRDRHPALHQLRNLHVHSSEDDAIVVFSKATFDAHGNPDDIVIAVVNVDPHTTRETTVHLDLEALGMGWEDRFLVHDEISGEDWTWGASNYVRLDPYHEPAHILTVRSTTAR
jgi:starch synthase (maltosyl-transferring)